MTCPQCNSQINDTTVYCNNCGKKINPSQIDNWNNVFINIDGLNVNAHQLTWQHCKAIGTIAYRKSDFYEAIEYFEEAIKFENEDLNEISNLYNELAISFGRLGKSKQALAYFDLSISANKNNCTAIANRANLRLNLQDENGAISDFNYLISQNKMQPQFWHMMGIAHENLKQYEQARISYQTAIANGFEAATKDLQDVLRKMNKS